MGDALLPLPTHLLPSFHPVDIHSGFERKGDATMHTMQHFSPKEINVLFLSTKAVLSDHVSTLPNTLPRS